MVHLTAVSTSIAAAQPARVFVDTVFLSPARSARRDNLDPRFTARFWSETFSILGTQLKMSTADRPETDGQTERVNRVLGDTMRSYAHALDSGVIVCHPLRWL